MQIMDKKDISDYVVDDKLTNDNLRVLKDYILDL